MNSIWDKRRLKTERFLEKVSKDEMEAVVTKFTVHAAEAVLNDSALTFALIRNLQNSLGYSSSS